MHYTNLEWIINIYVDGTIACVILCMIALLNIKCDNYPCRREGVHTPNCDEPHVQQTRFMRNAAFLWPVWIIRFLLMCLMYIARGLKTFGIK